VVPRGPLSTVARAWGIVDVRRRRLLLDVLATIADHELNPSAFAARVAASTGASLAAAVMCAAQTWSGPRHGHASRAVEGLLDEIGDQRRARRVLETHVANGRAVPGFGLRLYPGGDPRARYLLAHAQVRSHPNNAVLFAAVDAWGQLCAGGPLSYPDVDLGLVAAANALGLPAGGARSLFFLGRLAGWLAHVLEQRASPVMLRPRAAPSSSGETGGPQRTLARPPL
jgi:citrate synthase